MVKIFLSSHGHFASGVKSSLDILLGNSERLTVFDAYVDEKSVQDALNEFYERVKEQDQVILLSDLLGGSVNSTMFLYLEKPNTMLVAGANLALVLELAIRENTISKEELQQMVENSRQVLKLIEYTIDPIIEEEFF